MTNSNFPAPIVPPGGVQPAPRRVRCLLGGEIVVDTTSALYAWEIPYYPQYYLPLADVSPGMLSGERRHGDGPFGRVEIASIRAGTATRAGAARLLRESPVDSLRDTVRIDWGSMDAWYEEDERVFVHPRNPYVRVDALRSTRRVRVELEGTVLAESSSPVMVFETGLPTRYYLNRTEVDFSCLEPSDTVTRCPYKGTTSRYWSARIGDAVHRDLAWAYDFPTRQLVTAAGLVAFFNEKVDLIVDGERLARPRTHFS